MKKIILLMVLVMGYSAASFADERFEVVCGYRHNFNYPEDSLNRKLKKLKNIESFSQPSLGKLPIKLKFDQPYVCVTVKFQD